MILAVTNLETLLRAEWPWLVGLTLFMATALGFLAGQQTSRWQDRRAERKSRTGLKRLFDTVLRNLEAATEVCNLFDRHEGRSLSAGQAEHLERKQHALVTLLTRITQRQQPVASQKLENGSTLIMKLSDSIRVTWTKTPTHDVSELPDRTAFDASLASLLEAGRRSGRTSHLLVLKMDRLSSLVSRVGIAGVHSLTRKLASLVCRTVRDVDLVCQIGEDQLAVLLKGTDHDTADLLARSVRDGIRSHRFRGDQEGPEVLVTASFGLTVCLPDDSPDLVLDRAAHALAKSERMGRNQLHVHDGIGLIHCSLSA